MNDSIEECISELIEDRWIQNRVKGEELFKIALGSTVVQDAIVEQMKILAEEHWGIEGKGDDFSE